MDSPDLDTQLQQVVSIKKMIKSLETQLTGILDALALAVESGDLDDSFEFSDAKFRLSPGRATYSYPAEISEAEAALKQRKADAVAAGTATEKRGAPFWTIKLPE
jgi:hypothetical protein